MKSNSRILVVSYEYPPLGGGGAKVVQGLVTRLVARGASVDLVTMGYKDLPRFEEQGNLRIYRTPSIRRNQSVCQAYEMIPYIVFAVLRAVRLARQNRYFVNHTHFIFPDSLISVVVKLFAGVPFVTTAHGSDVPGYNPNRFKLLHTLLRPAWLFTTNRINRLICPSQFIQELIVANNPKARTIVIPNGIDPDRYSPSREKKQQILCVTRIFERKGVQYLIDAYRQLKLEGWSLKIVGDGPYLETLQQKADGDATIECLGYLENDSTELKDLYETSAIFSLPSASENFPIVLLEAMIAGAAIITTEGTGCQNVVADCAELVTPRDSEQIAAALLRLTSNPDHRQKLGQMGRDRAESSFSWEVVVKKHLALYDEVSR